MSRLLGLVVNPIAGMGGRVALKGTDGADALRIARARGATPVAPQRALRALARLVEEAPDVRLLAAPGPMGAELARAAGLEVEVTSGELRPATRAPPTRARPPPRCASAASTCSCSPAATAPRATSTTPSGLALPLLGDPDGREDALGRLRRIADGRRRRRGRLPARARPGGAA